MTFIKNQRIKNNDILVTYGGGGGGHIFGGGGGGGKGAVGALNRKQYSFIY